MPHFTHHSGEYLQVDDARLYFEVIGDRSASPIVALHGGLGSLLDFNGIVDALPSSYCIVGVDFRGHGRSTLGNVPLSYQQYQRDVLKVLDHLGFGACTFLGFSDGGIVAYRLAAQTPERVAALVTIGATWKLEPDGPVYEMLRNLTAEVWQEMSPESVEYYHSVNPEQTFTRLVQSVVALWTDTTPCGYPGESVGQITAPALLIRGDDDPLFPLSEIVELRQRVASSQLFNVPFAGHEVHVDSPSLFLGGVKDFLERTAARTP